MKFKDVVYNLNILKLDKMASCLSEYVDKVNNEKIPFLVLILTLKYTKTAQNYQDKKTNNIKIVILK